jgi:hypothetical protein
MKAGFAKFSERKQSLQTEYIGIEASYAGTTNTSAMIRGL